MKFVYLRTDFPGGRSHILMREADYSNSELCHYALVLSNSGTLWVDVFWPYDEESEQLTRKISEQNFWRIFREWRLSGLKLGDSEKVAAMLARKLLAIRRNELKV